MQPDKTMAVVPSWIEAHCVVPDGFRKGEPFRLYDYQLLYLANFYKVRGSAVWNPASPALASAFVNRRGMLVGPQKLGKNPLIASQVCVEFVGPVLFAGWAGTDDGYVCRDWGCGCGWEYAYEPGEPMGMHWPTPKIQITAFSEDSTENTYDALRPMVSQGPLADVLPKIGEEFIRHPNGAEDSRIDTVTSSNQSRLGQRVTFVPQDELGLWTRINKMEKLADTQYRGLAGMGGRASLTTNAWDPAENSVAQREFSSAAEDVYRQFVQPPKNLSYANKRERHKIHQIVYPTDTLKENGGHVDLVTIEAEAADMAERDKAQAERFFGNILATGYGKAFDLAVWNALRVKEHRDVPARRLITIGGDGSRLWDDFSLVATDILDGYQWPLGIWHPSGPGNEVPLEEIDAVLTSAFETFEVVRGYFDPPYIESWIATWAGRWGKDRIYEWWTNRPKAMGYALLAWNEAQRTGELSHCHESDPLCAKFTEHVGNAYRFETGYRDDQGQPLWVVMKEAKMSPLKIDSVPAATLSWEARNDAIAAGVLELRPSAYEDRGLVAV